MILREGESVTSSGKKDRPYGGLYRRLSVYKADAEDAPAQLNKRNTNFIKQMISEFSKEYHI